MSDTYEEISRNYEQARCDYRKGFREFLRGRGVVITSSEHLAAEESNYGIAHHEELTRLEALTVEFTAARASLERRAIEASELAAAAHDVNAKWARMMDDRLAKDA